VKRPGGGFLMGLPPFVGVSGGGLAPITAEIAVMKVAPKVISMLDYTKGFGHADLVMV
jgi:hypothetical protein